jgi:tetratricopeptide (TPR) repeat protein
MQLLPRLILRISLGLALIVSLWFMASSSQMSAAGQLGNLALCVLLAILAIFIIGRPLVDWVGDMVGRIWMPGDSSFNWQPQYSIAEARVKEGLYQEAVASFRDYITQYPQEPTPHLRIADLQLKHLDDPQAARFELEVAVGKSRSGQTFAMANFRLGELYISHLNDSKAALRCYHAVQSRYPKTKYARAAEERAQKIVNQHIGPQ